jgi:DNA-binding NarL/FixJ family response regulator/class 3 adenylate cyclase
MSQLPSGRVTFLLCDIEDSSRHVHASEQLYDRLLTDERQLLRTAISGAGGVEIDVVGDQLLAVFTDVESGVTAAVEAQRALIAHDWPEGHEVRVRMGVHVGNPTVTEEGYTGIDVHRTARVASSGHGWQIVVTDEVKAELSDVSTRDLGVHRLAGLPEPEHLHQVLAEDLPRDFPPLRNTVATLGDALTVVVADDSVLLREGVVRLLTEAGFDVVAQSGTADDLLRHVAMHKPAVAIVDIRMPPTHTDEGLVAARAIRERYPDTGVLMLSQYVEAEYAMDLLSDNAEGVGYLLKDRVADLEEFALSVRRVADGGSALDPAVVQELVGRSRKKSPLDDLTPREREVLGLMAEGRSNQAIAGQLFVTLRAVEKHVTNIFDKLDLPADADDHRRVLAVLAYLSG